MIDLDTTYLQLIKEKKKDKSIRRGRKTTISKSTYCISFSIVLIFIGIGLSEISGWLTIVIWIISLFFWILGLKTLRNP